MKFILTLTSLKYLVRKKKNQSWKKKILRETRLKKKLRELQKPSWSEINRKEFEGLTRDIYNNQDNNSFKIIISKRTYDLKNEKKNWMVVTTPKISKSEVKKLYNELIQKDTDALEREKIY